MEICRQRSAVVMSGPSGGGKSSILKRLIQEHPAVFKLIVSHTTRQPREGEINGKDYYFIDRPTMQSSIDNAEFIEYAEFSGNFYGTSKIAVKNVMKTGKICVFDVDLRGVKSFKEAKLNAKYFFIKPPTFEELVKDNFHDFYLINLRKWLYDILLFNEKRLKLRSTETTEALDKRLHQAEMDMNEVSKTPALFDHVILNDDFERAYREFSEILREEIEKYKKLHNDE